MSTARRLRPRRQAPENKRRMPQQARALETRQAILEAAAQILERDGVGGFTTNAVAERAGVSIGTLYQYFGDKSAIVLALARQEAERILQATLQIVAAEESPHGEARVRLVVRSVIHAFGGRYRARKAIAQAVVASGHGEAVWTPIAQFTDSLARRMGGPTASQGRNAERAFVISRAVLGAIRAAVIEEQPFLTSRSFEDELVRLVTAYVAMPR